MKKIILFIAMVMVYCSTIATNGCPENIFVYIDSGQSGVVVNYATPSETVLEPIEGYITFGYYEGKAFYLSDRMDATEAYADAVAKGGFVATVRNEAENIFIRAQVTSSSVGLNPVLIGLNDIDVEGIFVWHSGEAVSYTNWNSGEPNNAGTTGEDYVEMHPSGGWNDFHRGDVHYVLELPAPEIIQTAGLPSGEFFPVGTTTNVFSNGCIFTVTVAYNEAPVFSCPEDRVTFTDPGACGAIVVYETPSGNGSTGEIEPISGFTSLGINDGKAFYLSEVSMAAVDMFADAVANGGFVATVRNEAENEFLVNSIIAATGEFHPAVFIGINDAADEGVWVWHSGEPVVYTNWHDGEPNGGTGENYTEFYDGKWNDLPGTYTRRYVLEKAVSGGGVTQTAGLPSGSLFPVGTTTNTFEVTDAVGNTNTCSFDVTVNKRPTQLTYTGDTEGIYSDEYTLSAQLMDISDPGNPVAVQGAYIIFYFEEESLSEWTDASGVATRVSSANPGECEGLAISALFEGDCSYLGDEDSEEFTLLPEDAEAEYTGTAIATTISSSSDDFTVLLRGIIIEDDDDSTGDISKATARFVVDGVPVCGFMPVMLLYEESQAVGVIEYVWEGSLNGQNPALYEVQIEINSCFYEGMSIGYPLSVYRAEDGFITGGGHMIMTEAMAGLYPATPGSKLNFGFNVKYVGKGRTLQGKMNIIYRVFEGEELVKVYQIKSNALTSLGTNIISKDEKKAEFVSKANLTDVTDPGLPG